MTIFIPSIKALSISRSIMQETSTRYVVSDICDTLFFSNTTFDFIRFCAEQGWLDASRRQRWSLLLRRQSPLFWVLAVGNRLLKKDLHKAAAVGLLAGYDEATVRGWAKAFYRQYLEPRRISQAFRVLDELGSASELVLASSSIEPVVAEIAAALGVRQYVATTLEIKAGKYTGHISLDLTGRKPEALSKLLQLDRNSLAAVLSDNTTDRSLMELAGKGYAICYNDKQRQFWGTVPEITLVKVD